MNAKEFYDKVYSEISKDIPGFRIRYKSNSTFHKILGFILFFVDGYKNRVTTTVGKTVAFPSELFVRFDYDWAARILLHEWVHLDDRKRGLTGILYLFPQVLFVFSSLAILAVWFSNFWLLALLSFLFLLPLPAPIRVIAEKRGYAITIMASVILTGGLSENSKERVVGYFRGSKYYFMAAPGSDIESWIAKVVSISKEVVRTENPAVLREVKSIWLNSRVAEKAAALLIEKGKS